MTDTMKPMSLLVDSDIFSWLQTHKLVATGTVLPNGKVELPRDIANRFFDGMLVCAVCRLLLTERGEEETAQTLEAIKENVTPAMRVYNWNILTDALLKLKYSLDYSQKSRILGLEGEAVNRLLRYLFTLGVDTVQVSLKHSQSTVNLKHFQSTNNLLDYLVSCICEHFHLPMQQTRDLLARKNRHQRLSSLFVHGLSASFEPVVALLKHLHLHSGLIANTLLNQDQHSTQFLLSTLKPCLVSEREEVAANCLQLFASLHLNCTQTLPLATAQKWMAKEGVSILLQSQRKHPPLFAETVQTILKYIGDSSFAAFDPASLDWHSETDKLSFLNSILWVTPRSFLDKFLASAVCSSWLTAVEKRVYVSKRPDEQVQLLRIFQKLFQVIPRALNQPVQQGLTQLLINFAHARETTLFVQATRLMFSLIQSLGQSKHPLAPVLFKILVNCLLHETSSERVQFLSVNFVESFRSISSLPGRLVMRGVLKCLNRHVSLSCLQLCRCLLESARVSEEDGLELFELLLEIVFTNVEHGLLAVQCIQLYLQSFDQTVRQTRLCQAGRLALAQFYSCSHHLHQTGSKAYILNSQLQHIQLQHIQQQHIQQQHIQQQVPIQEVASYLQMHNLVVLLQHVISEQAVKEMLKPLIFHTYIRVQKDLSSKAANMLMSILLNYQQDQKGLAIAIECFKEETVEKESLQYDNHPKEIPKEYHKEYHEEYHKEYPELYSNRQESVAPRTLLLEQESARSSESSRRTICEQWKPIHLIQASVQQGVVISLDTFQRRMQEKRRRKEAHEKEQQQRQEKKQRMLRRANKKRILQFGSRKVDLEYDCVQPFGSGKGFSTEEQQLRLFCIEEQEQDLQLAEFRNLMRKYRKVWRHLFFKFSSCGKIRARDGAEEKITTAELLKLLKYYELDLLNKDQVQEIVRKINENQSHRQDLHSLTYVGFEEFLLQASHLGYGKNGYGHLSPASMIKMLLEQMKVLTGLRGFPTAIFSCPQEVYFQETDVLHEFNRRLQLNPEYFLPQGYKKMESVQLQELYTVDCTPDLGLFAGVLQILDQIISEDKRLGFHLLQPKRSSLRICVAKPCLFQQLGEKMKDYKGRFMRPLRADDSHLRQREQPCVIKTEFHLLPRFSLGIKLGLASVDIRDRYIAQQVAHWVDDLLDAVEHGTDTVGNKAKRRIDNQVSRKKRAQQQHQSLVKRKEDAKLRNRSAIVKQQAEIGIQMMQEARREKFIRESEEQSRLKLRQEMNIKRKQQEFEQAKTILNSKRRERQLKQQMGTEAQRQRNLKQAKDIEKYVEREKNQLLEKAKQLIFKKEDELNRKQETLQKLAEQKKRLELRVFRTEETVLQNILDLKHSYEESWKSSEIQEEMAIHRAPLKYLYDLLLKHQLAKAGSMNSAIGLSTVAFFAIGFRIVPIIIDKVTLALQFKFLVRHIETSSADTGLSFHAFEQLLFRIIVKAKHFLNKTTAEGHGQQQLPPAKDSVYLTQADSRETPAGGSKYSLRKNRGRKSPKILAGEYLLDASQVTKATVNRLIQFLKLPSDKAGVERRFRQILEKRYDTMSHSTMSHNDLYGLKSRFQSMCAS